MAVFDINPIARPAGLLSALSASLTGLFETPFDRRAKRLASRVAELRALSDEDLRARGLTRDEILGHVFKGRLREARAATCGGTQDSAKTEIGLNSPI